MKAIVLNFFSSATNFRPFTDVSAALFFLLLASYAHASRSFLPLLHTPLHTTLSPSPWEGGRLCPSKVLLGSLKLIQPPFHEAAPIFETIFLSRASQVTLVATPFLKRDGPVTFPPTMLPSTRAKQQPSPPFITARQFPGYELSLHDALLEGLINEFFLR